MTDKSQQTVGHLRTKIVNGDNSLRFLTDARRPPLHNEYLLHDMCIELDAVFFNALNL